MNISMDATRKVPTRKELIWKFPTRKVLKKNSPTVTTLVAIDLTQSNQTKPLYPELSSLSPMTAAGCQDNSEPYCKWLGLLSLGLFSWRLFNGKAWYGIFASHSQPHFFSFWPAGGVEAGIGFHVAGPPLVVAGLANEAPVEKMIHIKFLFGQGWLHSGRAHASWTKAEVRIPQVLGFRLLFLQSQ